MKKRFLLILSFIFFFLVTPAGVQAQTSRFGEMLGKQPVSKFGLLLAEELIPTPTPDLKALVQERVLGVKAKLDSQPKKLTVAVLGDSMVDVLQPDLPQLRAALRRDFPDTDLRLYNFGVGASNLEYASYRLANDYDYLGKSYPSVLSIKADILVLESFAYNNFGDSQRGLDKQWLLLGEIITKTEKLSPNTKIILAAAIAPNSTVYGDGIDGVDWPLDQKAARTTTVKKYLENLTNFANSQGYPLADAYHSSLPAIRLEPSGDWQAGMDAGGEGKLIYINAGDHLHPSGPGGELFCQEVAEEINKMY